MSFRPGTRVGHYEIGSLLGEGGMGEVYRARDLTLHRDVAVKVLADRDFDTASALARFEREARVLASLNHPGIASIFGMADAGGVRAIVMELVEGPTLVERLAGGALPVPEALSIAAQIAEAVEAAHEKGIVHRDLKPANIKFTASGAVKVLDFGIAKALAIDAAGVSQAATVEATRTGVVMGTAAYMSPEQARGLAVDTRSDVWAFGVVAYEMLAGRRAFAGATTSDVVAAVLTASPDWSALPPSVPPRVVRLLQRCLERDPARRLRQIGAARYALEETSGFDGAMSGGGAASSGGTRPSRAAVFAGVAVAFAAGAAVMFGLARTIAARSTPPDALVPPVILAMNEPPGEPLYLFAGPLALSPDGTRVALVTNSADGKPHVWLQSMSGMSPELLRGADGGMNPFWSPDGRSLGFFAEGQLKIADLDSGAIRTIAPWTGLTGGGAWNPEGVIVFSESAGLRRVSSAGGAVTPVTTIAASQPVVHTAPRFLPDGRHFVYFAGSMRGQGGAVMVGSIDGGEPRQVMTSGTMALYAAPGHLIYQRDGEIVAQPFDTGSLSLTGDPIKLATGVWAWTTGGMMALSASDTGLIVFATRRTVLSRLTSFDRSGRPTGTIGEIGEWVHVAVSPDERTVAAERMDPRTGSGTIWTIDLARNAASRLTPEPTWSLAPIWSRDGASIVYGASRQGASDLYVKPADGGGPEKAVLVSPFLKVPTDWTRDGRLVFNMVGAAGADIAVVPVPGGGDPVLLVNSPVNEASGKVSPDGRWLAYVSNESGRNEVYVRGIDGRGRWPVSRQGGGQPRWRRDGNELFFVSADSNLMAARVTSEGSRFSTAEPEALPIRVQPDVTGWRYSYDVLANGQRVIASVPTGSDEAPPIVVISRWTALLHK